MKIEGKVALSPEQMLDLQGNRNGLCQIRREDVPCRLITEVEAKRPKKFRRRNRHYVSRRLQQRSYERSS